MLESGDESVTFERVKPNERAIKQRLAAQRAFDLVVASVLLVFAAPVMLLVALAILVEDGRPVFFFQNRVGRQRKQFRMVKFRSMQKRADEGIHRRHVQLAVNGKVTLRLVDDPRITRVGRVIRRWSFDELPNLFNVINGDMSMVGPRPLVPYEAAHIGDAHSIRFAVRPGITGLAQVNGRLDMTYAQRLDANIEYVVNRTVWTDLVIMAKTVPSVLSRGG